MTLWYRKVKYSGWDIIPAGENFCEIALEWVTLYVDDLSSMLCKLQTHWLPRFYLAQSHLLLHWCGEKRWFLSPQEKVQTTVVFCPRSSKRMCDLWGLLLFPRPTPGVPHIGQLSLKSHSPYTKNCQKVNWLLALREILGFQGQNVFWKPRREKHRLPLGPPSLVYSVLFSLMNPSCLGCDVMTATAQVCMLRNKHDILLWPWVLAPEPLVAEETKLPRCFC